MARYSKEYKLLENNRNSKSEIKGDLDFITEIIGYVEKEELDSAKTLLSDWQGELGYLLRKEHEAVCMCYHLFLKGKITKEEFTHIQKLSNTETKENSELIKQILRGFKKRK